MSRDTKCQARKEETQYSITLTTDRTLVRFLASVRSHDVQLQLATRTKALGAQIAEEGFHVTVSGLVSETKETFTGHILVLTVPPPPAVAMQR